ncbi:hypothetical protein HCN44_006220 [Aphidius gifuensis]|uniref:Peptidase M12B domain-containing protein n=1 Tax=Aphidius gifuensis TaxID=684658 RepID=A0A835CV31_APHGI|nr:venom metalloproteinase 2-like [Aphidius gifuensis]KAF7997649.1 hypothetical protein HCN44_006220 [Aphidius gifuensis]
MMISTLVVLLCFARANLAEDLYQQLTPEERTNIFQTSSPDDVPEYEIVPIVWPKSQRKGQVSNTELTIKAFGEDIKLQLNPTDGVLAGYNTPIYMAKKYKEEMRLDKYSNLLETIHTRLFEDFEKGASLVVSSKDDGNKKIIGSIISKNLAIKPIPERFNEEIMKQRKVIDTIQYHDDSNYHIVHKIKEPVDKSNINISKLFKSTSVTTTVPDIIYPEILVVVDDSLYQKLGGNVWEAIPYLLAFWNGVDLKYRSLDKPKWRLNIAGIVLAKDSVLTYLDDNKRELVKVELDKALDHSGVFWYKQNDTIPIDSYDLVATMTAKQLCSEEEGSKYCDGGVLGVAYYACACKINTYTKSMAKVSLITDNGAYDGVHTATHELAHLFGADHDEADEDGCSYWDGYIMAASPMVTDKSHYWSNCTVKEFQKFFDTNPTCLYNKPIVDNNLPTLIPGKYLDANAQCTRAGYGKSCDSGKDICKKLKCYNEKNRTCEIVGTAAADGTKCGYNKFCFRGECIDG